jgi:hypothetical protein
MKLSKHQRIVLGIYVVVMLCMCLYVPHRNHYGAFRGYSFLWSHDPIDVPRLFLSMLAVTLLSAVVFVFGEGLWKTLVSSRVGQWARKSPQKACKVAGLTALVLTILLTTGYWRNTVALYTYRLMSRIRADSIRTPFVLSPSPSSGQAPR